MPDNKEIDYFKYYYTATYSGGSTVLGGNGSGTPNTPVETFNLLQENGDDILQETGDTILLESAP